MRAPNNSHGTRKIGCFEEAGSIPADSNRHRSRCLVGGWRLLAANLALAAAFGLRLTGWEVLPSSIERDGTSVCQHADWLDDIIDIITGGGSGGDSDPGDNEDDKP